MFITVAFSNFTNARLRIFSQAKEFYNVLLYAVLKKSRPECHVSHSKDRYHGFLGDQICNLNVEEREKQTEEGFFKGQL